MKTNINKKVDIAWKIVGVFILFLFIYALFKVETISRTFSLVVLVLLVLYALISVIIFKLFKKLKRQIKK